MTSLWSSLAKERLSTIGKNMFNKMVNLLEKVKKPQIREKIKQRIEQDAELKEKKIEKTTTIFIRRLRVC